MRDMNVVIGETFAKYRKEKGFSQQYVADRMGVGKTTVHYWEKGKRQMYAHQFMELCAVLGIDPSAVSKEVTDACV